MNPAQQLREAGFNLALTDAGKLTVGPRANLTPAWVGFVQEHRAQIVLALTEAANDAQPLPLVPPPPPRKLYPCAATQPEWARADRAYQAHHFQCPACIAAGHGRGLRCPDGLALLEAVP